MKKILLNLVMIIKSFVLFGAASTPFANGIKAVIFDCDGVLVDTEYLKYLAWQKAMASVGLELSVEDYKKVAGLSSVQIFKKLEEIKDQKIPEDVIILRRENYQVLQVQGVPPIDETIAFVRHLSKKKVDLGIKLGLASSACRKEILINLKQIGLEQDFDLIISGSDDLEAFTDPDGKNKPKPYIYLEASKRLNISPKDCLVLEDTEAGIEAVAQAGMIAVAIPNWMTESQNFSKAAILLTSISELKIE